MNSLYLLLFCCWARSTCISRYCVLAQGLISRYVKSVIVVGRLIICGQIGVFSLLQVSFSHGSYCLWYITVQLIKMIITVLSIKGEQSGWSIFPAVPAAEESHPHNFKAGFSLWGVEKWKEGSRLKLLVYIWLDLGSNSFCKLLGPNKNELVIFKNKLLTLWSFPHDLYANKHIKFILT